MSDLILAYRVTIRAYPWKMPHIIGCYATRELATRTTEGTEIPLEIEYRPKNVVDRVDHILDQADSRDTPYRF